MSVILATAGYDHKIRFWEAPSGICSRIIKYPDSQVNRLQITPDKQFIAAAGNPHIRLYEILNTTTPVMETPESSDPAAQDGGGGNNSNNTNGGGMEQQPVLTLEGHTSAVTSIGFQKDGRYLYSGSEDGTIKVWDLRNPNFSRSFDSQAPVNSVTLRSDRDEFISGDQNGYVKVWDLRNDATCLHSFKPHTTFMDNTASCMSRAGSSSRNHTTSATPPQTPPLLVAPSSLHSQQNNDEGTVPIQAVDISEDSQIVVAVSNHGIVYVWGTEKNTTNVDRLPLPQRVLDDPAAATNNSPLFVPIRKFRAHAPGRYGLQCKIAPDCHHVVTTGSDGLANLWDTTTWELSQSLRNHTISKHCWVWDAAFCADSSYLVTASSDNIARLWNLRSGDVVRQYHGHTSAVTCVALNDSSV